MGSKPKDVELLQEVSDSEASAHEGPIKRAAPTTGRRGTRAGAPSSPVSRAKKKAATPTAIVRNPRKRKKEPVIGGDGKVPKRRKIDE